MCGMDTLIKFDRFALNYGIVRPVASKRRWPTDKPPPMHLWVLPDLLLCYYRSKQLKHVAHDS